MQNCISMNPSNLLIQNHQVTLFQYGKEPININLAQHQSLNSIIKLVSEKNYFKKIRLFDHRCIEIYEEDLKYLKKQSKIYVTTNGKALDSRFILYEYNPQSIICKGGQASVMLISHKITQIERALKFIGEGQENQYLYIAREAVILEQLKHKNIVKMYSYKLFPDLSEAIIELEYIKGGSLFDYINDNGPLSEQTARNIFIQILDGIMYCHRNNVIHRDLKLDNILISDSKELKIKIIDFGLSYLTGTGIPFDEPLNVGTVLYAAPEIVFGKLKAVNFSVDIWALGVILYYMVFGKYPFSGEDNSQILINISEGNYNIPSKISWELVSLITDIFNPDHEKRISLYEIRKHNWTRGIIQQNHLLSIPISDLPTTSKDQQTQENSVRKTKEDLLTLIEKQSLQISTIRSEKFCKRMQQKLYKKIISS